MLIDPTQVLPSRKNKSKTRDDAVKRVEHKPPQEEEKFKQEIDLQQLISEDEEMPVLAPKVDKVQE